MKPSYGVAKYQPYQLQQQEQPTQEYKYEANPDPAPVQLHQTSVPTYKHHYAATKHSAGNYHTSARHADEENHDDHHVSCLIVLNLFS